MTRVTHGFPPERDATSELLILGSFPSVRSRAAGFFYMHPRNRFWRILAAVYDPEFATADVPRRKELLRRHGIALYDVIETCTIEGSADATIRDVVPADIGGILAGTAIRRILVNGATAWRWFERTQRAFLPLGFRLPSTSPANAAMRDEDLLALWRKALQED